LVAKGILTDELDVINFAEKEISPRKALENLQKLSLIVVIPGTPKPRGTEALISLQPSVSVFAPLLSVMNRVGEIMENLFSEKLFSFTLGTFEPTDTSQFTAAIYNIQNNEVLLNSNLLKLIPTIPTNELLNIYTKYFDVITAIRFDEQHNIDWSSVKINFVELFGIVNESLWLCIVCIVVASYVVPFAANYIMINLALLLCQYLNLDAGTCQILWTSAIALVFALLPIFAYLIFLACNLQSCTQQILKVK